MNLSISNYLHTLNSATKTIKYSLYKHRLYLKFSKHIKLIINLVNTEYKVLIECSDSIFQEMYEIQTRIEYRAIQYLG